jgi:hypothetical protein
MTLRTDSLVFSDGDEVEITIKGTIVPADPHVGYNLGLAGVINGRLDATFEIKKVEQPFEVGEFYLSGTNMPILRTETGWRVRLYNKTEDVEDTWPAPPIRKLSAVFNMDEEN